jgi:predicted PurR-regulated permease PerM
VFAGLAVHVLTVKLARKLPAHWSRIAHEIALAVIMVIVITVVFGVGFAIWSLLHGQNGMADLLVAVAGTLERIKQSLPADMAAALPDSVDDLREQLGAILHENSHRISAAGMAGVKTFAHILLGMVIGGMTAINQFGDTGKWPPLAAELHARARYVTEAFDKVVFAQVKISALNTVLTAIYLLVILPLCGVHLPLVTALLLLTFVAGIIPVIGNLISNSSIVLISLGVSPGVGASSLVFLILVHKLEYFTNARIVGGEVHARAWELLCAMLFMEAVFGMAGMVAAPVVYAWIKAELAAKEMI